MFADFLMSAGDTDNGLVTLSVVDRRTRSSARGDLAVQRTRTKFGGRAFVVFGAHIDCDMH